MKKQKFFLKIYRKRAGVSLTDMAFILGIDHSNLSKMEFLKVSPSLKVIIAYYVLLNVPFQRLFNSLFMETMAACSENVSTLRENLLRQMTSDQVPRKIIALDRMIDRLEKLQSSYER